MPNPVMMNYYVRLRKQAAELDPEAARRDHEEYDPAARTHLQGSGKEVFLTSLDNEQTGGVAGRVCAAVPMIAAKYLAERTHRLSTTEEIADHQTEMTRRKMVAEREAAVTATKGNIIEVDSAALAAAIAGIMSTKTEVL